MIYVSKLIFLQKFAASDICLRLRESHLFLQLAKPGRQISLGHLFHDVASNLVIVLDCNQVFCHCFKILQTARFKFCYN